MINSTCDNIDMISEEGSKKKAAGMYKRIEWELSK
jgi:hypothetical protein